MNVKPNDMAVIVEPFYPEGRGYVVKVVRPAGPIEEFSHGTFVSGGDISEVWVTRGDVPFPCSCGRVHILPNGVIPDFCLRRIDPKELEEGNVLFRAKPTNSELWAEIQKAAEHLDREKADR